MPCLSHLDPIAGALSRTSRAGSLVGYELWALPRSRRVASSFCTTACCRAAGEMPATARTGPAAWDSREFHHCLVACRILPILPGRARLSLPGSATSDEGEKSRQDSVSLAAAFGVVKRCRRPPKMPADGLHLDGMAHLST